MAYLVEHPPVRSQFREHRRANPSGAIVVHTTESNWTGGAVPVAKFIAGRSDPGSYHSIVDDAGVLELVPYTAEAYGEGTGGNRWALHLAFACKASDWHRLPKEWVDEAIEQAAWEAVRMAEWVHDQTGIVIPAALLDRDRYRALEAGFIGHGTVDPARRHDPGTGFPWDQFLGRYTALMGAGRDAQREDTSMAENPYEAECNEALQLLAEAGYYTGKIDGWFGPEALDALHKLKNDRTASQAAARWAAVEPHLQQLIEWAHDWDNRPTDDDGEG